MRAAVRAAQTVACLVLASSPAGAEVIRWHVPGIITGPAWNPEDEEAPAGADPLLASFPPGTQVDFEIGIDTGDVCDLPQVGIFHLSAFTVSINGHTGSAAAVNGGVDGSALRPANIGGCVPSGLDFAIPLYLFSSVGPLPFSVVEMLWFGDLPGDGMPRRPPDIGTFFLSIQHPGRILAGELGPATVVPEPAMLVLFFSGLAAAAMRRRGRRHL